MPRYELMVPEQAQAAGIADPKWSTWQEELENNWDPPGHYVVDTVAKVVIGQDGGEPEDQTLYRDWSWVVPALNEAYQQGRVDSGGNDE